MCLSSQRVTCGWDHFSVFVDGLIVNVLFNKEFVSFGIIHRGEFYRKEKTKQKTCQSKMFCFVFSQLHLFGILGLVQTQLGIITMHFNIYVALAIIKLHKQGCLFSPFMSFF